jgi:hypothetical protein
MFKMLLLVITILTTKGEAQGFVKQMNTPEECEAAKSLYIKQLAADPDVKAFGIDCGTITLPDPNTKT